MFNLNNRVAVVTGASAGLGVNLAKALARQGADIAILARRKEKLEAVAEEIRGIGANCLAVKCDVTRTEDIKEAVLEIKKAYGKIDILVNNAGGGKAVPTTEMTDEIWLSGIDLNLSSTFKCCREFGKEMIEAEYGRIVNVSSMLGLVGTIATAAYGSAKAGIINLTRILAAEWATKGVTVNALVPGFFQSETNNAEKVSTEFFMNRVKTYCPMKRIGREGELDSAILFLTCEESSYVTGTTVVVDGGWTCV
jgi:NAD(P)-dependent dehydrogenase (short-subunit alcohol dehydrogenase family)